jgi:hypothetical protein
MIRLEKIKQLDRYSDQEKRKMVAEIKASKTVTDLIKAVLDEKISHLESQLMSYIEQPYQMAAAVKTVSELKTLTKLFEETNNDNT